jgi:hypothetical protein
MKQLVALWHLVIFLIQQTIMPFFHKIKCLIKHQVHSWSYGTKVQKNVGILILEIKFGCHNLGLQYRNLTYRLLA